MVLCEVETIPNDRPITRSSMDPNDLEVLTPNHLLLLKIQPLLPPGLFQKEDLYIHRRWRQVQYMSDLFWKRWIKESYLNYNNGKKGCQSKEIFKRTIMQCNMDLNTMIYGLLIWT